MDEFLGFGTTCDPNCCLQSSTGADDCGGAVVHAIAVPPLGDPPMSVTVSGDTTNAGLAPETCPALGEVWWEAFSVDANAEVTVDFCCSDPPANDVSIYLAEGCPCANLIEADEAPDLVGCGDGNGSVKFTVPAGTYYVPVLVDRDENDEIFGHPYQMHILVAHPFYAACCEIGSDTCTVTDRATCEEYGYWLGGGDVPVVTCAADPCVIGACCIGDTCDDGPACDTLAECETVCGGVFVGYGTCADDVCTTTASCDYCDGNLRTGPLVSPSDRSVNLRAADDLQPAGSTISALCWVGRYEDLDGVHDCGEDAVDDFVIRFYDDAGGMPGAEIGPPGGQAVTVAKKAAVPSLMGDWLYNASLDVPLSVDPGNCYWMEITNDLQVGTECVWVWASSASAANKFSLRDADGSWGAEDAVAHDLAFCIDCGLDGLGCGDFLGHCCTCSACQENTTLTECTLTYGGQWDPANDCGGASCPTAAANDDCLDAIDVVGDLESGVSIAFDNRCATRDGAEGSCPESGVNFTGDVWFNCYVPDSGLLTVSQCDADYDGMLAVYGPFGDCDDACLTVEPGCPLVDDDIILGCDDDGCCSGSVMCGGTLENIPVEAGACYKIRVGGRSDRGRPGGQGTVTVTLDGRSPPTEPPVAGACPPEDWPEEPVHLDYGQEIDW